MTKHSYNRRLVVVTASMVLAGGGMAVPAAAVAAPVALQHDVVALDDAPDSVYGRGITDRGDDDTRGADVRAREDPDGVNTRGSSDPPVDESSVQARIQAGF
ncbi:hypothetical protein [Streptomyces sp. NBC_01637]|uniref:hypothetical protein n=1 Tax=unclassified Streptomyces TaxID=2593676 RepID=UPI00386A0875|nr:hypothetical protein OH719_21670 [Streptomyces sp. NBC_01653]WTD90622.1 hypothetical protein OG891_25210 [Streptomyces sp. NBC_01637]